MRVKEGHVPPGGWHFMVTPQIKIEASSRGELLDRIFEFRLRNKLPLGDVARDLDLYVCSQWPTFCRPDAIDLKDPSKGEALKDRHTRWTASTYAAAPAGGYPLVLMTEAAIRAESCKGCPRNKSYKSGCTSCAAGVQSMLLATRKSRILRDEGQLLACELTGEDLATSIHLPAETVKLSEELLPLAPPNCWKLKIK